MKGNDGRAARKMLIRRLVLVFVGFFLLILFLTLLGFGKFEHHHNDIHDEEVQAKMKLRR